MLVLVIIVIGLGLANVNHHFADSLFRYGFYREAVSEYRRCLLDTNSSADTVLLLKLGLSLAASGSLSEATEVLHRVADITPRLAQPSLLALAGFNVRAGKLAQARLETSDLLLFTVDSADRSALYAARAWLALREHDFDAAYSDLSKMDCTLNPVVPSPRGYRSPTLAAALSSLVPGTGEVYAGQVGPGLLSMLVTALTGAATYWSARSGDWVTAAVIFSTMFLRFYNGSRRNALDFVNEHNRRREQEFAAQIIATRCLQPDWFRGIRPLTDPGFPMETESAPARRPTPP